MDSGITHFWFRSGLSLAEIATKLELKDSKHDCEDTFEWLIGGFNGVEIDVARDYRLPRWKVDVSILLLEGEAFTTELMTELVNRLLTFVRKPIRCGHRVIIGNNCEFVVVHTISPTA